MERKKRKCRKERGEKMKEERTKKQMERVGKDRKPRGEIKGKTWEL